VVPRQSVTFVLHDQNGRAEWVDVRREIQRRIEPRLSNGAANIALAKKSRTVRVKRS